MYALATTSYFDRRVAKFTRAHPELKTPLAKVLRGLETDPFQPHLRLHALKGELEGLHAVMPDSFASHYSELEGDEERDRPSRHRNT